ncbi:threonine aldolase [Xylariales sp. PMI_506]|nr:threonine aldolase [Xylariales sp. PMI_506]
MTRSRSAHPAEFRCTTYFASDNYAGAHPAIAASLSDAAGGFATAYGASDADIALEARFNEIFEREVAVYFVATGTAANSLALASVAKPGGVVFAHREAHIIVDECGAVENLSNQLRITPVDGSDGKMSAAELRRQVERVANFDVHGGRPNAVSVTQASEAGTVYSLEELDAISVVAKQYGLPLHMDGARFANALVRLGCTPAEMTWKRGVDILSFGGTKNGCWCAEAVIFFDPEKAREFPFIRKRSAQLISKSRFISVQFNRYLKDGLWLDLARHANDMATLLADALDSSSRSARLAWQPQSNEVYAVLRKSTAASLRSRGVTFYEWLTPLGLDIGSDEEFCRFVTSFATTEEDVETFRALLADSPPTAPNRK